MIIRPSTLEDVIEMTGDTFPESIRSVTAEHEGKVVAIAGVRHSSPPVCFSDIRPEIKEHPRAVAIMIRRVRKMLSEYHVPIYAIADANEPTAPGFLQHVGFEFVTSAIQGEVYRWHN